MVKRKLIICLLVYFTINQGFSQEMKWGFNAGYVQGTSRITPVNAYHLNANFHVDGNGHDKIIRNGGGYYFGVNNKILKFKTNVTLNFISQKHNNIFRFYDSKSSTTTNYLQLGLRREKIIVKNLMFLAGFSGNVMLKARSSVSGQNPVNSSSKKRIYNSAFLFTDPMENPNDSEIIRPKAITLNLDLGLKLKSGKFDFQVLNCVPVTTTGIRMTYNTDRPDSWFFLSGLQIGTTYNFSK
jgi:hypothetical protein